MRPFAVLVGLVFGAVLGAVCGTVIENRPVGFAIGLVGGLGVALMLDQRMRK